MLLALAFIVGLSCVHAQEIPSIADKTKALNRLDGYLPLYADEANNKIFLLIDKWNSELLYQQSLPSGLGSNDIGLDRGTMRGTHIIYFEKAGSKVLMVEPNYSYRAVSKDEEEKKAVSQSFARSVLWGFTAVAATNGAVLVDATDLLLSDMTGVALQIKRLNQGNFAVDKTRSAIDMEATKNFPFNTELSANITWVSSDGSTGAYVRSVSPTASAFTLQLRHSFIQLPDDGYTPRYFDPRSSFINTSFYDYASPVSEPLEKHFIIRHRLQKKDKGAAISDPVKPIIYYLDRGTPEPIRSALLEGASWWNQAFEAAGYRNAFQVKILPPDADPMDIRYNMINWVHRSTRGWSYGAAVVDPRSGEILKGNVTLGSLRVRQDYLIFTGLLAPFENGTPADDKMLEAALARLRQLSAHEVGHTIGLMHNYAASISNRASVMDYPHPLVSLDQNGKPTLANAYAEGIGAWDKVAIRWGYGEYADATTSLHGDASILRDAFTGGLQFISDRDARAPGGLHPQAHLWDNGKDAVDELGAVMKVRKAALANFDASVIRNGTPMAMLEDALVPVYFYHRYQLEAVTKIVGGAYYNYALRGDGQAGFKPMTKQEQLRAMDAILQCMTPEALMLPQQIAALIPPRPAGYQFGNELFQKRTGLAFDMMSPAETAADLPLSFLFNSERLNRLEQQQFGTGFASGDMMDILVKAIWKTAPAKDMAALIQMQTAQVLLTYLLSSAINDDNSYAVRAQAAYQLQQLKVWLEAQVKGNLSAHWKAHYQLALDRMKAPEKAKPTVHKPAPPGAPIGCDW